ncbi:Glycosyltransferase family 92 [Cognatiyoonia sediminum]|uniref:Glycosyltransferase family 92 n=1 Tax=Cognatiyoonia sediminum TaxID=1508389 RepID=A0A1M5MVA4_9RHOB|nr:glycosyltransferase family 92 protein [Cognatiyoonia sediminum]SHG81062.1 Glycosyltransferase family 92 [Cognatiyoonia sediminum]
MFGPRTISKLSITSPSPVADRAGMAICLIVRNEERHIGEWADFHLKAGVEHFVVYDNGCTDGTVDVLKQRLAPDQLTLMPWDQRLSDGRSGAEIHNQVLAYAHALRNFGGRFRWMAFIDVDEFLIPTEATSLGEALAPLENAKHISLPWHMFGRNGHETAPEGGVLTNYLNRARDPLASSHALNWKCIVDPCHVTGVRVHGFDIDGRAEGTNDVGKLAKHTGRADRSFYSREAIQLNHYYTRSNAELQAKINRGSNKTVEAQRHIKRVMRIVDAIEADTVEDSTALDFLNRL